MAKRLVVLLVLSASVLACRGSAFIQSLGSIPQPVDFGRIAFRNGRMEIFPLSFIYAVVRHRVLGVSLAIRRGLQYALMSRGVLVAEGIAVFIALYLVVAPSRGEPGERRHHECRGSRRRRLGLGQVNRRLKAALDRRFFREPYNAQPGRSSESRGRGARAPAGSGHDGRHTDTPPLCATNKRHLNS